MFLYLTVGDLLAKAIFSVVDTLSVIILIGTTKSIGYRFRTPSDQEKSVYTAHREFLTVVWAVFLSRLYLERCWPIPGTNHHANRWILYLADAFEKLVRWLLQLLDYDSKIVYRADVKQRAANELSGLPAFVVESTKLKDEISVMVVVRTKNRDQKNSVLLCRSHKKKRLPNSLDEHNVELLMLSELIMTSAKEMFGPQSPQLVQIPSSAFTFEKNEVLVRKVPIDRSIQKLVHTSLRALLLQRAYHWTLAGLSGVRRIMYRCNETVTGHTWSLPSSKLLWIIVRAQKWLQNSSFGDSWNSFHQLAV